MKKLLVAAIMLVLATPAFAAIQNVKVSGDITESYITDNGFNLGLTGGSPNAPVGQTKQSLFLSQVRLRVDADLSDNVSTTVGLINERAWNGEGAVDGIGGSTPTGYDTNVQVYLASITLRELLYSPLTVTIGRQVFNYGNGFIMGDGGAINSASGNLLDIYQALTERTAYDGVTATLDYKPLTISLIYFKNGETLYPITGSYNTHSNQSSDVYGWNANYQLSDPWNTVVEQYMFARINGSGYDGMFPGSGAGNSKGSTLYVPGLRASTNPIKGLNVQGELAWQLGSLPVQNPLATGPVENEHRDAMAAQFLASYSLPVLEKYKPTVNASYTYVSGDKNAASNYDSDKISSAKTNTAWDEFNTIQGAGTIYRSIFLMSNESIVSVGASVNPLEDVTAAVTWSGLWSVDRFDNSAVSPQNPLSLLQPDNSLSGIMPVTNKNAYWLGNETDVNLTYNYTEDVTFGLSLGWFVPGDVFVASNHDTASQAIANVGVKF
jgi:hypothetical protein